jgi:type II secretory pathway pseudopilin PulG
MRKINNNLGFTLVELIAILLILGVLIGVLVPRYMSVDDHVETKVKTYETNAQVRKDVYNKYLGIEKEPEDE